jgi:hypothetical protein
MLNLGTGTGTGTGTGSIATKPGFISNNNCLRLKKLRYEISIRKKHILLEPKN